MIIVIANVEINEDTKREELIASHGIDTVTGNAVVLPQLSPHDLGARFSEDFGEFVLYETRGKKNERV